MPEAKHVLQSSSESLGVQNGNVSALPDHLH